MKAPVKLEATHQLEQFDCGEVGLNQWLQKQAAKSGLDGAARTYVVCEDDALRPTTGQRVVAYYCLASGSIVRNDAPGAVRRNMPDPIPVMVIGRLAVDVNYQNHKLGTALLKDALLRVVQVSEIVGIRAVLVHAISEQAKGFYLKYGFQESPSQPMTLVLVMSRVKNLLA